MAQKAQAIVQQPGLFERIFEVLHFDFIAQKIKINKQVLIDSSLFGLIGFIIGFLCKRYSEYVIMLAFFVICLCVFNQFNIITISINIPTIYQILGITNMPVLSGETYLFLLSEWIKGHIPAVISFCVGCLIGIKVG